ncbi:hypothetical protein FJT64_017911 [Amphibalanus amphitrite]|uniref:Uncharacterized protein n=1 Tax=Amphibalanus amphitrite TaxID=1232801 RepID=A0A6A4WUN4_AMPAM|nr:hypothetical protein FJT64_017911 [Amphibalanus amphitrite]
MRVGSCRCRLELELELVGRLELELELLVALHPRSTPDLVHPSPPPYPELSSPPGHLILRSPMTAFRGRHGVCAVPSGRVRLEDAIPKSPDPVTSARLNGRTRLELTED